VSAQGFLRRGEGGGMKRYEVRKGAIAWLVEEGRGGVVIYLSTISCL